MSSAAAARRADIQHNNTKKNKNKIVKRHVAVASGAHVAPTDRPTDRVVAVEPWGYSSPGDGGNCGSRHWRRIKETRVDTAGVDNDGGKRKGGQRRSESMHAE